MKYITVKLTADQVRDVLKALEEKRHNLDESGNEESSAYTHRLELTILRQLVKNQD